MRLESQEVHLKMKFEEEEGHAKEEEEEEEVQLQRAREIPGTLQQRFRATHGN